jgi:radical SAM protein with 4Fe4S-binding SPASM domain
VQLFNTTAPSREQVNALDALLAQMEAEFADEFASGLIAESPDKLRRTLVQYFGAMHGMNDFDGPRCNAPHFSTVIEVDGKLRPCYFLPEYGQLSVESVRGRGALRQAINANRAFALRAAYRGGERAECKRCVCPLYRGPRALLSM